MTSLLMTKRDDLIIKLKCYRYYQLIRMWYHLEKEIYQIRKLGLSSTNARMKKLLRVGNIVRFEVNQRQREQLSDMINQENNDLEMDDIKKEIRG